MGYQYKLGILTGFGTCSSSYLDATDYDATGQDEGTPVGACGDQLVQKYAYDQATSRLIGGVTDLQTDASGAEDTTSYTHNQAGDVTSIQDAEDAGTTSANHRPAVLRLQPAVAKADGRQGRDPGTPCDRKGQIRRSTLARGIVWQPDVLAEPAIGAACRMQWDSTGLHGTQSKRRVVLTRHSPRLRTPHGQKAVSTRRLREKRQVRGHADGQE